MATKSLFGNIFDVDTDIQSAREKSALNLAQLAPGRVQVAGAGMAGGMLGGGVMEGLGYQNPGQQKQQAINEVWKEVGHLDLDDSAKRKIVGNAFIAKGLHDIGMDILKYDDKTKVKVSATQQQKLADMDATLNYLEVNKGFKLNPTEAAYFKSRIKKDVSVTMGGQVIDTAPNVFDQIISQRKNNKGISQYRPGISDSSITSAGLEKKVGDLSTKVLKADISDLDVALTEVENMFTMYGDKDIPGLSALNIIERQTEEGGINSGMVEAVKNILLKLRSGAAVTESEQKRFLNEISGTKVMTDELWKQWIARIRKLVEQKKKDLFAGERKDVLDLYWQRQGTGLKKSSPLPEEQQDVLSKYNL
jgi:hypothetical protein